MNKEKILSLVQNGVQENKKLEYKEKLKIDSDRDKKEFLADISAFSNANGGIILYGIKEENGIPQSITGIESNNIDDLKLKIENLLRDCISPRIKYEVEFIKDINVLLLNIPRGYDKPHQVLYKGHEKFYSRNSAGKYKLDLNELKRMIINGNEYIQIIKNFISERIEKIYNNESYFAIEEKPKAVLHIIPIESFKNNMNINIQNISSGIQPISPLGRRELINLDGRCFYSVSDFGEFSYLQIFRNGVIEAVSSSIFSINKKFIPSKKFEVEILKAMRGYIQFYKDLSVQGSFLIKMTLIEVKDFYLAVDPMKHPFGEKIIERKEIVKIPEILKEELIENESLIMKPIFDMLWNNFGYKQSDNYIGDDYQYN